MGNQDTLRNLLIAGAVFIAVMVFMPRALPPSPPRATTPTSQDDQGSSADSGATSGEPSSSNPTVSDKAPVQKADPSGDFVVVEAAADETRIMGSAEVLDESASDPYRMRLVLSNIGASVETATMTDHAERVDGDVRYKLLAPCKLLDETIERSLAIEKINIDGSILTLHDKKWNAEPVKETETGQTVSFWIDVLHNGEPAVRVRHRFDLPKQPIDLGRHDLDAALNIENLSTDAHEVIVTYLGGVGVSPTPGARMASRVIDWGTHDGQVGSRVVGHRKARRVLAKDPGSPIALFAPSQAAPGATLSWAAIANTYFTSTIAPLTADGKDNPTYLATVSAVDLDGSDVTESDLTIRFVTRNTTVAPGATLAYPMQVYLGEKDHSGLREVPAYSARNYYYQISQGFGFCTFSWLVDLMIRLLNGLHFIVRDYGVAIIILVLIVRLFLHPITKKGQINMVRMQHRMQEMAPKIEEIKKKYANDKARLNQEMMKLNINPAGQILTCLPMFIQMPIWVALFLSLSNNIQMRHQPFLFTWVNDLTVPDALYTFSAPIVIPVLGWELPALNLLPLFVALFMYLQQKMQPKPAPNPNMTDQQKQQQDTMKMMMPMMSVMMLIFFYKAPSGLNLYIMFSSLFGTLEQHHIRSHIKQREAAGTLHKPKQKGPEGGMKKPKMPGFLDRLQKMADQAQKPQSQQTGKGKLRR